MNAKDLARDLAAEARRMAERLEGFAAGAEEEATPRLRVLLEVGHGPAPGDRHDPGAVAGTVEEHRLNRIAAIAAMGVLDAAEVDVEILDAPMPLYQLGRSAAGYDVFVSIHHNAYNGAAQGAEAFVLREGAEEEDRRLARELVDAITADLGVPDRGVKEAAFAVLAGARSTDVRAACLVEPFFLDAVVDRSAEDLATAGGRAIGEGIQAWAQRARTRGVTVP